MTSLYPDPPRTMRPGRGGAVPLRHAAVDQWLVPIGDPLREIAAGMVDAVDGHQLREGIRERARKGADLATFTEMVGIVVANLAHAVLIPPRPYGWLAMRMGNRSYAASQQENRVFGKQAPKLVYALEDLGFVAIHRPGDQGVRSGERYSIGPTEQFRDLVTTQGVTLDHFGRHPGEDLLLLKFKFGTEAVPRSRLLNYPETALTARYKAELLTINQALARADIAFLDDPSGPLVDHRDRTLRRRFIAKAEDDFAFDKSGRLYGGFWQNLKATRRGSIRIDGEPVADLDFKNMFVRLAYAVAGETPPGGDLYAVPGLEEYRSGVKLLTNTLFWDEHRRRKNFPRKGSWTGGETDADARREPSGAAAQAEGRFPADWTYRQTLKAIQARHPKLTASFGVGIGGRLMHQESEIMVRVLHDLIDKGITALPVHDGVMVAQSRKGAAMEAMRRCAREVVGAELAVVEKT